MKPSAIERLIPATAPLLLGALAFLAVVGPRALRPSNIAWLGSGDRATHYLGWQFFRASDWSFPLGLNPRYGLELSNAIVYSDSNPLLAILFKPFSPLLSEPFQYLGIWLFACFILQAWFGWKIIGLFTGNAAIRILGAGFFVFAPPMLHRLQDHLSLAGHFIVLAALYLALHPNPRRRMLSWGAVLTVAALVHAYLLAMVVALWLADLLDRGAAGQRRLTASTAEVLALTALVGVVCWQAGYLTVGEGVTVGRYGFYRTNLLSLFDSRGWWSYLLKAIPTAPGDYEGFSFLGLGALLLLTWSVYALIGGRVRLAGVVFKRPALLLTLAALAAFAVSHKIGISVKEIDLQLPEAVVGVVGVFQSSGRMFWPVFYALLIAMIYLVVRANDSRGAIGLLALALGAQIADTSAGWREIRNGFMVKPSAEWVTPLKDPFWGEAAARYRSLRGIPPANKPPQWQALAAYAGRQGLGTDAVYLARIDKPALAAARRKASEALRTGRYEPDSLYVLNPESLRQAVHRLRSDTDLLARIDGLLVLAPGWKRCSECSRIDSEVRLTEVLPPVKTGERIEFSRSGKGPAYLAGGWAEPEAWGVWSVGPAAGVVLPVSADAPRRILLEANALVAPRHPRQTIEILVNDAVAKTVSLTEGGASRIEVDIPDAAGERLAERGMLDIELKFADAVSPRDLGLTDDPRELALGLLAITVQ